MYKLREERDMKPATFSQMVSSTLYEKRCAGACPVQAVVCVTCQAGPAVTEGGEGQPLRQVRQAAGRVEHRLPAIHRRLCHALNLLQRSSCISSHRKRRICASAALHGPRRFGPYFVSPVIAGLDPDTAEPYLAGMDTIGAIETAKDFMVAGTAPDSLYGMCESMWRPDMVRAAPGGL